MIAAAPAACMLALHFADDYWWHLINLWRPGRGPWIYYWNLVQILAYGHFAVPMYAVFTAAMTHQASMAIFGEAVPARTSLRFAFARWRNFLWVGVLDLFVVLVAAEATVAGTVFGLGSGMDALGLFNGDTNWAYGAMILIPSIGGILLLLWLAGCFGFLMPACALEGARGRKALQRSWVLSREGRWRVALTWLLLFLLRWSVLIGIEWAFRLLVSLVWRLWPSGHHVLVIAYRPALHLLASTLAILMASLYPVAVTLFYYDQRIRKEGFDIERMMAAAGMDAAVDAVPVWVESGAGEVASVPVEGAEA